MQDANQILRYELWNKLKVIFDKYATSNHVIQTKRVQEIVRDVLGQTSPQEIQYVIKNMFRLDTDGSGAVDFHQFGNFLFKRHCGQIALQVMHKQNMIQKGAQRKINLKQFFTLVNHAYSFLKVKMDMDLAQKVFKQADADHDGQITYVQYFQYIEKCICQTKQQFKQYQKAPQTPKTVPPPKPVVEDLGREWNSRLRRYLWGNLKKLYDAYVHGKDLTINDQNLRGLIQAILGQLNQMQMTFLLNGLFKLPKGNLAFLPFAIEFIYLVVQLGLSRYQRNHPSTKKMLNCQQFIILLKNTFKPLNIGRVKRGILQKIFGKIDTNKDGLISISQYLNWAKKYLSVDKNHGQQYYTKQDDQDIGDGDIFEQQNVLSVLPDVKKSSKKIRFNFSDYGLSDQVRKRVWQLLIPFDKNKDKKFDQPQIHDALINLLKQDQFQLAYMTRNVFRYDKDSDKNVTYQQLTNFCVEQHFGQMAIQRLHKKTKTYSRGAQRIMNQSQFGITLNNALGYIGLSATPQQIHTIFTEIDLEHTGWISYEIYFLFLQYYFGEMRGAPYPVDNTPAVDPDKQWLDSLKGLSALQRLIRILRDQFLQIFDRYDFNKNKLFEEDQIDAILQNVFGLNQTQSNYVLLKFFDFAHRNNKSLTSDQLIKILQQIYFIDILLKRKYPNLSTADWKTKKINLQQFKQLFNCTFLRVKPDVGDLAQVFKSLDTDHDNYITIQQYMNFVKKYLGLGLPQPQPQPPKPVTTQAAKPTHISDQQWGFINQIWNQLKQYFDKYDQGKKGYLNQQNMKKFVVQVLHQNTQKQLDYIFWNFFRVDPNSDRKTQFNQFAPFILLHAGQIALQRFHREQVRGKKNLTQQQLFIVFSSAFSFLSSMPKSHAAVHKIYTRIGQGSDPSYGTYLGWINKALANKFR